jgi:transcriptional regulator with XRE-family HTH domain
MLEGFSERLNETILKSGISMRDLAKRLGTDHSTVRSWMVMRAQPNIRSLAKLCLILDVSADYLIYGKER